MLSLLLLAVAPGLAIALYIYRKDKYQPEPISLLVKCFLAGMLSVVPALFLEIYGGKLGFSDSGNQWNAFIYAYFIVALAEEGCKYFFVYRLAYRNPAFDEPFDGIVYSVMVSMGFATLENIFYVYQYGMGTGIMRMFTAVPAHAAFAVLMGFFLGKAKFNPAEKTRYMLYALGSAIVFHGTYDYSLFEIKNYPLALLGAVISLAVGIRLARKAMVESSDSSPFRYAVVTHDTSVVMTDDNVTVTQHDSIMVVNDQVDITDNDPNK